MGIEADTQEKARTAYLTTIEMYNLDSACRLITRSFYGNCPYLVGTCAEGKPCRDVDVRLILDDAEFDALFAERPILWELLSISIGDYLRQRTALAIDFQIQRQSEANELHPKVRNPLGMGRRYAGGGDGVPAALRLDMFEETP